MVVFLAALSLFAFNCWEAKRAENTAKTILSQLEDVVQGKNNPSASPETDPYNLEMTVTEIDDYGYVGYLSIPALDLELPVMSQWDYTWLKISPCRYSGSTKTDDLVICAHNYTRHFGLLFNLAPGDVVYFTDMNGKLWCYEVTVVDILSPTAVEDMTAGDCGLTLFTCTYGGGSQVLVRCERIREE